MQIGTLRAWASNPGVVHILTKNCEYVHKLTTKGWETHRRTHGNNQKLSDKK